MLAAVAFSTTAFLPREQSSAKYLVYPNQPRVIVVDNVFTLVLDVDRENVSAVKVFVPWDSTYRLDVSSKAERAKRVQDVANSLPQDLVAKQMLLRVFPYHQPIDSEATSFNFSATKVAAALLLEDTTRGVAKSLFTREGSPSTLQITGWAPLTVQTKGERKRYCQDKYVAVPVTVLPGLNVIPYEILSQPNQRVHSDTLFVYYNIELSSRAVPTGFTKPTFHTATNEAQCLRCHNAAFGKQKEKAALQCGSCHAAMTKQKSVHGLLAANDCAQCHDAKPGSGYRTLYAPHQENAKCFECHETIGKEIKGKKFVHAPLAGGQCSICHSPHGSPNVFQLRMAVNDICVSCHDGKDDNNHPVVFHPTRGTTNPLSPSSEFTCTSCHLPHASDNKNMLASDGGYFALCQQCHQK